MKSATSPTFKTTLSFSDAAADSAAGPDPRLEDLLRNESQKLATLLSARSETLVLAESCTAGRVSAALGEVPGISSVLAGSWVTYQRDSKVRWLGVRRGLFQKHPDAVSAEVAESMALQALKKTPHATWAAAITGHLNPPAHAWLAAAHRSISTRHDKTRRRPRALQTHRIEIDRALMGLGRSLSRKNERANRQVAASILLLRMVRALITLGVSKPRPAAKVRNQKPLSPHRGVRRRKPTRGKSRP